MQSSASNVADYLASLSEERRHIVETVRRTILANLDSELSERMQYGMIGYVVPHSVFPAGYHCDPKQPLPYAGIASQKNYVSIYLSCVYSACDAEEATGEEQWFRSAWAATGKKLDMGKSCIRIKRLDDVPLDVIGEAIHRVPARKFIERYQQVLAAASKGARKRPA